MKRAKFTVVLTAIVLGAAASGAAFAHGPHVRFGFAFGGPVFWPYPYYAPYPYYYPPPVVVQASPPVYIERGDSAAPAPQQSQSYWYYCVDAKAYYPYVKQCPGGWQRVTPQPPAP